jgi:aspartate/methionine/tyrosine aminotransferase
MKRFYDVDVDPQDEVTVTAGATEGMCATLLGLVEPGDEVILLEPAYDTYAPVAALARAKTKAIVINTPQNPCCKVFSREDLSFIGALCERHDAYAISDEVYEHIVYDGRKHVTLLSIPELRNRALVISSTAKTFSMTGWKVGYVIGAPELSRAVRMSHQFITFCGQSALQEAMAFAVDFPDSYYEALRADYTRKRDWLCEALTNLGFRVFTPEGTYYVLAAIRPLRFDDDLAFCRMLPQEAGVAAIPGSYFWKDRRQGRELVRFCFCKRDETLQEAITRLKRWLK